MLSEWDRRTSRELDSFEEFFFYMEEAAPALHFHVVTVKGETATRDWKDAWQSLHAAYPLLKFRIIKEAGERPRFVETGRSARIEIEAGGVEANVAAEAERALAHPFTNPEKELVSLRVVHSPTACVVSLTSHHSLFDGMSTLLLLQDLLERVSGGAGRTQPPPWSSLRDSVGAQSRNGYRKTLTQTAPAPLAESPGPVQVRHLVLDPLLTKRIEDVARQHGTTPHGALMVAFQLAGAVTWPTWVSEGVGCNTPHNVRGQSIDADATGMLTMPLITFLPPVDAHMFWDAARAARNALAPARATEGRVAFVAAIDDFSADEMTASSFLANLASSPMTYELMITDYASYRPRTRFGSLRIEGVATGNNGGSPITQTIGVCTVGAAMNLTQISRQPIKELLKRCREVLVTACA